MKIGDRVSFSAEAMGVHIAGKGIIFDTGATDGGEFIYLVRVLTSNFYDMDEEIVLYPTEVALDKI
jgi:hypothetical protein